MTRLPITRERGTLTCEVVDKSYQRSPIGQQVKRWLEALPAEGRPATKEAAMRRITVVVVCAVAMGLAAGQGQALNRQPLTVQARHLAAHGGIRSSRYGDATPRLKALTAELIRRRFRAAGWGAVARAICIAQRESGMSIGAVSSTQDYGVSQIHIAAHPEYSAYRLTHDPVYSVNAFWRLSSRGRDWGPWAGGRYQC